MLIVVFGKAEVFLT